MLLYLALAVLAVWLLGAIFHVAGAVIHLLLVVAAVMLVLHFVRGRASA